MLRVTFPGDFMLVTPFAMIAFVKAAFERQPPPSVGLAGSESTLSSTAPDVGLFD